MLKAELVEMAIEAKMSDNGFNRTYWVKRFNSMTKAEVELYLEGFTTGDRSKMAESHKVENGRKRATAKRADSRRGGRRF